MRLTSARDMSASRSLPSELWDLVIDRVRDSPTSLKSCSLVCHRWTERTRRYLFRSLHYSDKSHVSPGALAFFLAGTPTISRHIVSLFIENQTSIPTSALLSIILSLPKLFDLTLESSVIVDDTSVDEAKPPSQLNRIRPMRTVGVVQCSLSEGTLYRILDCFTYIIAADINKSQVAADKHAQVPPALKIVDLALVDLPMPIISKLLRLSSISMSLISLNLFGSVESFEDAHTLGELLPTMSCLRSFSCMPWLMIAALIRLELPDSKQMIQTELPKLTGVSSDANVMGDVAPEAVCKAHSYPLHDRSHI